MVGVSVAAQGLFISLYGSGTIALLMIYPKNEKDGLTPAECKVLKQIIERWR